MKKLIGLLLAASLYPLTGIHAQLTLEECQRKAQENYPLARQYGLIEKSEAYNLANANKGYLPQLSLSAKATYQSDVTEIPVRIPGLQIDNPRKDQYQATLQLDQVVWDGGTIRSGKQTLKSKSEVERRQFEVNMYTLNDRVNQLFFGILQLDEQLEQNRLLQEQLRRTYQQVSAYLANGTANQADLDAVRVEQLDALQTQSQLEAGRNAYRQMLSALAGIRVNDRNKPVAPEVDRPLLPGEIRRPELNYYLAQQNLLDSRKKQLTAKNLPRFGLFVQGAVGNPGLNMLKNEFVPYYIAGIKLSWNFGNLYTRRGESRLIDLDRQSVDVQRETFLFNTRLDLTQTGNQIAKLEKLMKDDDEIIALRTNIRKAAEAKVANGTLTVTEMLREITSEDLARQNKVLHRTQWLMEIYNLKNSTNN